MEKGKKLASSLFNILTASSLLLMMITTLFTVSHSEQSHSVRNSKSSNLTCEMHQMKLKISHLEIILEQSIQSLDIKFHYLREKEKLIEGMTHKIDFLHTVLANMKVGSKYTEERISALEEEVRLLWAASRKNNFDIHNLESQAQEANRKIQTITSKVRKMEDIITEQWIQIRQLDHAFKLTEMRTLRAKRRAAFTRCKFLKFIKDISGQHLLRYVGVLEPHLPSKDSVSYVSQVLHQLSKPLSAVKMRHHELQGIVKQAMERNLFTTAFANQEVIFFVASAMILFPLWVAWMMLLCYFSK